MVVVPDFPPYTVDFVIPVIKMIYSASVEEITSLYKCPSCGRGNVTSARVCEWPSCGVPLKADQECLWSIDEAVTSALVKLSSAAAEANASLKTIKNIAVWFLILSILSLLLGLIAAGGGFR